MAVSETPAEVKDPISLMSENSILGLPLFARLVPFAVHQAESVYSERKQNYVKDEIIARFEELDEICKRWEYEKSSMSERSYLDV